MCDLDILLLQPARKVEQQKLQTLDNKVIQCCGLLIMDKTDEPTHYHYLRTKNYCPYIMVFAQTESFFLVLQAHFILSDSQFIMCHNEVQTRLWKVFCVFSFFFMIIGSILKHIFTWQIPTIPGSLQLLW